MARTNWGRSCARTWSKKKMSFIWSSFKPFVEMYTVWHDEYLWYSQTPTQEQYKALQVTTTDLPLYHRQCIFLPSNFMQYVVFMAPSSGYKTKLLFWKMPQTMCYIWVVGCVPILPLNAGCVKVFNFLFHIYTSINQKPSHQVFHFEAMHCI